jgi:hypothetical protein
MSNNHEQPPNLSEKSTVTLSLLAMIIGAAAWMTSVNGLAQSTSTGLNELKSYIYTELRAIRQELKEIRDRLPAK